VEKAAKIYVAGHRGLVGSALCKVLHEKGYTNLVYRTHAELDLTNQKAVQAFFEQEKPEYVFLAAARVGGIVANNTYRGAFIYENMMIQNNVIHQSYLHGVKKLLFLGSTCIYPKECPQPMKEEYLLTAPLEYTNEPYAIAKIAGIKMCESYNLQYGTNFISVMPTNLYGPNDNFDLETSHVLPALLRKMILGNFLHQNDFDAIRKDFQKRPIEGVNERQLKKVLLRS
jgi:GDP-L-fucose synthase